jgi:hypothetical protein
LDDDPLDDPLDPLEGGELVEYGGQFFRHRGSLKRFQHSGAHQQGGQLAFVHLNRW